MTYKLVSTEMTQVDDLHEGAQGSRGLRTECTGVQEREPDSIASSSKARDKGKSKEEDYGKIGNPENKENKVQLQLTELLNKVEGLRNKIDDLAKMISESPISLPAGRKQAHSRSGVDSAGKFETETEISTPHGESGSREERPPLTYGGKHRGNHHAGIWRRAPGHGSYSSMP